MLQTKDGPEVIHVTAVDPRGIRGRKRTPTSYTFLRIALSALTDEEVVERVRPSKPHGRYLAAVAMAARRMPHAQAAMASFDDPLSALIATRLPKSGDSEATRSKKQPAPENGAKAEFSRLLHGLGLPPQSGAAEWFKLLFAKRDDADYLATVRAATQLYLRQYGAKLTAQQRTLGEFHGDDRDRVLAPIAACDRVANSAIGDAPACGHWRTSRPVPREPGASKTAARISGRARPSGVFTKPAKLSPNSRLR